MQPAWADDEKGVIWVDMTKADPTYTSQDFIEALGVRLPGWSVNERPINGNEEVCNALGPGHYIARIETTALGKTFLTLASCGEGEILIEEQIDQQQTETKDGLRRAAVLAAMRLDLNGNQEEQAVGPVVQEPPEADPVLRARPLGTVGTALGLSVAGSSGDVALSGLFDLGVLLANNLWIKGGLKLSTSYEGVSEKEDAVSVTDRAVWLGLAYLIAYNQKLFSDVGLALQYTHAALVHIGEKKPEVEEISTGSRVAVRVSAGLGVRFFPVFALFIRTSPVISLGRRDYKIRGKTAVQLGIFMLDVGVGALFFF
ncbi:MAG: hypothetical protein QNJ97_11335 [Myxococcota bacterium]|nr:hypothetical protein [Myxococcota bacterium]